MGLQGRQNQLSVLPRLSHSLYSQVEIFKKSLYKYHTDVQKILQVKKRTSKSKLDFAGPGLYQSCWLRRNITQLPKVQSHNQLNRYKSTEQHANMIFYNIYNSYILREPTFFLVHLGKYHETAPSLSLAPHIYKYNIKTVC